MARGLRGRNDPPVTLFAFQDVMTSIIGILLFVVMLMALQISAVADAVGNRSDDGTLRERVQNLEQRKSEAENALDTDAMAAERARRSEGFNGVVRDRERLAKTYAELERIEREIANRFAEVKRRADLSSSQDSTLSDMIAAQQENERLKGELDLARLNKRLTYIVSKGFAKRPVLIEASAGVWRVAGDANGDTMISLAQPDISNRLTALSQVLGNFSTRDFYCLLIVKPSAAVDVNVIRTELDKIGFNIGIDAIPEDYTGMIEPAGVAP
jgi:hypothetical protein